MISPMNLRKNVFLLVTVVPLACAFSRLEGVGRRLLWQSTRVHIPAPARTGATKPVVAIFAARDPSNDDGATDSDSKLAQSRGSESSPARPRQLVVDDDVPVKVNIIDDVDPVTLTAIGFTLLAINFFILANAGDGGIAGTVASIINLSRQ